MTSLHPIEKNGTSQGLRPIDFKAGAWESGYWKVIEETAQKLVGGDVFFHSTCILSLPAGGRLDAAARLVGRGGRLRRVRCAPLFVSRGRHLAWLVFLFAGGVCWYATVQA